MVKQRKTDSGFCCSGELFLLLTFIKDNGEFLDDFLKVDIQLLFICRNYVIGIKSNCNIFFSSVNTVDLAETYATDIQVKLMCGKKL